MIHQTITETGKIIQYNDKTGIVSDYKQDFLFFDTPKNVFVLDDGSEVQSMFDYELIENENAYNELLLQEQEETMLF